MISNGLWRKTSQALAPISHAPLTGEAYDVYPGFPIGSGKIMVGFEALAQRIAGNRQVIIDGYGGVFWDNFRDQLGQALDRLGYRVSWQYVGEALRPSSEIESMVQPFLGGDDPIFGTRFTGNFADFFDPEKLKTLSPASDADLSIVYGCGAALSGWSGLLVYLDVPKNEIQFRARAGAITNLAAPNADNPQAMYKRFYFVDWVALNKHKADLLPRIELVVDEQRPDEPTFLSGADLRSSLEAMSRNFFRVRPWFEPGPWGGQWIKAHIPGIPLDVPNYAWSFELIVPENGLMLESDHRLCEVSFDFLMFYGHRAVLGQCADRFGYEFPIRFDFLDTFDGGNLSLQCHPRPEYVRSNFGETFTQDETYYILDCKPGAQVYLGFKEDIDPSTFRSALEHSVSTSVPVPVEQFVTAIQAHKHDLFLIPNGTIHCSGVNALVLEISATPYIFTFKMYDWMRLGLDGKPRPLNIQRAFDNLYFERKGDKVHEELVSKPYTLAEGEGWTLVHLPTHPEHFYDVHRLEFVGTVEMKTEGSVQVMSLVEGKAVVLETANGLRQRFSYAETFVVPAAAKQFKLITDDDQPIKVIKSFIKP